MAFDRKKYLRDYFKNPLTKEKQRGYYRLYGKEYRKTPKSIYAIYKSHAKVRGYFFGLTFEQFMVYWQKPCHYCGDPIETIGLDRVDNSKGYILGNVVPCCSECNYAKKSKDVVDYIIHCAKVVNHFKMLNHR